MSTFLINNRFKFQAKNAGQIKSWFENTHRFVKTIQVIAPGPPSMVYDYNYNRSASPTKAGWLTWYGGDIE